MEREAFLRAINELPWDDESARLVFADWLDEHGEHDEADRQRRWLTSERWLRDFAEEYSEFSWDYDYDSDPRTGSHDHNLSYPDSGLDRLLCYLAAHVKSTATEEDADEYSYNASVCLPFDTPYCKLEYSDALWDHFEVVTRLKAPNNAWRKQPPPLRCSC